MQLASVLMRVRTIEITDEVTKRSKTDKFRENLYNDE